MEVGRMSADGLAWNATRDKTLREIISAIRIQEEADGQCI
jgi:hypothetical protein